MNTKTDAEASAQEQKALLDLNVTAATSLMELMVKHGVTRLVCGPLTIERPLPPPPPPAKEPTVPSEFERMLKMSPDKQDAALMLRKIGGG